MQKASQAREAVKGTTHTRTEATHVLGVGKEVDIGNKHCGIYDAGNIKTGV